MIESRNIYPIRQPGDPEWPARASWTEPYKVLTETDGIIHGRNPSTGAYIQRMGVEPPVSPEMIAHLATLGFEVVSVEVSDDAPLPLEPYTVERVYLRIAIRRVDSDDMIAGVPAGTVKDYLTAQAATYQNALDLCDAIALDLTSLGIPASDAAEYLDLWLGSPTFRETNDIIVNLGNIVGFNSPLKRRALFSLAHSIEDSARDQDTKLSELISLLTA